MMFQKLGPGKYDPKVY